MAWPLGLSLLFINSKTVSDINEFRWVSDILSDILFDLKNHEHIHIDRAGICYAALGLAQPKNNYIEISEMIGEKYASMPGAEDGLIAYTIGKDDILVDTLGMLCPFMARLGRLTGNAKFTNIAKSHLQSFNEFGMDSKSGWISHAFKRSSKIHSGMVGWGRGVGWMLLGLTDTLLELDDTYDRDALIFNVRSLLEKLSATQRHDGHWPWCLTQSNSTKDSSVTTLVAYSLSRLISTMPLQFGQYSGILNKCYIAIDEVTSKTGFVTQASGEAGGIGKYSDNFGPQLWALGPAVAMDKIVANHH